MSLTHVLRWAHWWNSTEAMPDDVSNEQVAIELNTDYSTRGQAERLKAVQIEQAVVGEATQRGLPERDSRHHVASATCFSPGDPMQAIVDLVAGCWACTDQGLVVSCLKGIFATATVGR
jgi:hypothetical protein